MLTLRKKKHALPPGADATEKRASAARPQKRLISAILAGTLLNPLNSSMIAVVLLLIQTHFSVSVATVSLLLSSFSLAAAIAQPLMGVYAQFAGINILFYAVFFVMPLWLEQVRGFASGLAGLLLLPISGIGVLATPVAARLISRSGSRPALIIGALLLVVGSLLLLILNATTPVIVILAVGGVLGIPNGFNNLGLQADLYEYASAQYRGAASGQFQTFRYVGAILATSLLGTTITNDRLHIIAVILVVISVLLLGASLPRRQVRKRSA